MPAPAQVLGEVSRPMPRAAAVRKPGRTGLND